MERRFFPDGTGFLLQGDARRLCSPAASPDEEVEFARFGYVVQVVVVEAQQFRSNLERNGLAFAGTEKDFLEAFQLAYRPGDASYEVADI